MRDISKKWQLFVIHRGDAEFVDIIHTNSGNLWDGCLSFPEVSLIQGHFILTLNQFLSPWDT